MAPPLTKQRLATISRELAYALLDGTQPWQEFDVGLSMLDIQPGAKIGGIGTFQGLTELGVDGKPRPISDETKEKMRAAHSNIVGTQERWIDVPHGYTQEEAMMACLIVESAFLKNGFKPYVFRDIGDLVEVSVDGGDSMEANPDKIYLRTNVKGAVETIDMHKLFTAIDDSIKDLATGWVSETRKGVPVISKKIDIMGTFPFLDQFAENYAKAMEMEDSMKPLSAGRGGLGKCTLEQAERHIALHEQAGYPFPRVGVELSGDLAQRFMSGLEVTPTPKQRHGRL